MNSKRAKALLLAFNLMLVLMKTTRGQIASSNSASTARSTLTHAMEHTLQMNRLVLNKATAIEEQHQFSLESGITIRTVLNPETTNPSLSEEQRNLAKKVSEVKSPEDLRQLIIELQNQGVTPKDILPVVLPAIQTQEQVLETKAPSFSLGIPVPGAGGTLAPLSCPTIYHALSSSVQENATRLTKLARSVGRIEVVEEGKTPSAKGTAFVIDQEKGLIATACHVVGVIADQDMQTGGWTMPKNATPSVSIRIDFSDTNEHNPALEFSVNKVVYVPSVSGCDGAILSVAKTNEKGGSLPIALPISNKEPVVTADHQLDAITIGYPDFEELDGTTPDTANYFRCVSQAANSNGAKFLFGGAITSDESMGGYHLQTHVLPTTGGQSGSPIIDFSDPSKPTVIGIHICCVVGTAEVTAGPVCQQRNEPFMEESVSIIDLMKMYDASQVALLL